ncbi:hypothetical protein [Dactylosporangium fulvum]|uniref:Uncharacterized protein n=1 Tax=Dactylosporangium fulvum TaxID=53359 RepID=A0ABY5WAU4_9ACTN|nr:hypothetical protein [Dactylosporangium fulvum]UWP86406.1 hypothetical protein Dfulv_20055 [Dactylosporangium fulvum]
MRIYRGGSAYHLVTMGDGVEAVDRALTAAGLMFTRTPTTVAWPGGRADGVEFVHYAHGADQRVPMNVVHGLIDAGVWLLYHKVDATAPN